MLPLVSIYSISLTILWSSQNCGISQDGHGWNNLMHLIISLLDYGQPWAKHCFWCLKEIFSFIFCGGLLLLVSSNGQRIKVFQMWLSHLYCRGNAAKILWIGGCKRRETCYCFLLSEWSKMVSSNIWWSPLQAVRMITYILGC